MRIAIGQIWQETNTFNPLPTTRRDEDFGVLRGPEVVGMAETNAAGGFIQSLRRHGERPEIVGLVRLAAWPGERRRAHVRVVETGTARRQLAPRLTAVLLALYGALVAEDAGRRGELLETVRGRIGARVPRWRRSISTAT
ncbi:MAG: M81 family metallopeptidase [Gemmataceae bacterium]